MHPVKKSTFSSCPSLRLERRQVLCVEISALKQQRKAIKEQLRESAKQAKKMAKRRKKLMKAQVCVFNRSFRLFRLWRLRRNCPQMTWLFSPAWKVGIVNSLLYVKNSCHIHFMIMTAWAGQENDGAQNDQMGGNSWAYNAKHSWSSYVDEQVLKCFGTCSCEKLPKKKVLRNELWNFILGALRHECEADAGLPNHCCKVKIIWGHVLLMLLSCLSLHVYSTGREELCC